MAQLLAESTLPGLNSLRHPTTAWPSSHQVSEHIDSQFRDSPFRYFAALRSSREELVEGLKLIKADLTAFGPEAGVFHRDRERVAESLSLLNNLLSHCRVLPHDKRSFDVLSHSVDELQKTLSRLYGRTGNPHEIANRLDRQINDFSQCAERFFAYEARKYAVFAVAGSTPLSVPWGTLNRLAGNPSGAVVDIDDCIVFSEAQQKLGWEVALRSWATSNGFTKRDPAGVESLCQTVQYCLQTDATSNLLQLLCDICKAHGFGFEVPAGMSVTTALEQELIPHRGQVMVDAVRTGAVNFTPGARDLLMQVWLEDKALGFCTNTPRGVSEPMMRALFSKGDCFASFDEVFSPTCRVFGDTTPVRKPYPLMWLTAVQGLGLRPRDVMIVDNSLNNCLGASDLARYGGDPAIEALGFDILNEKENFAAIVGVTNGVNAVDAWRSWAFDSPRMPVKVVVYGLDRIEV